MFCDVSYNMAVVRYPCCVMMHVNIHTHGQTLQQLLKCFASLIWFQDNDKHHAKDICANKWTICIKSLITFTCIILQFVLRQCRYWSCKYVAQLFHFHMSRLVLVMVAQHADHMSHSLYHSQFMMHDVFFTAAPPRGYSATVMHIFQRSSAFNIGAWHDVN
jgi:hypothetical protein